MKLRNKTQNKYFVIFYTEIGEALSLLNKKGTSMQLFDSGADAEKAAQKHYSDKFDSFEVFMTEGGVLKVS